MQSLHIKSVSNRFFFLLLYIGLAMTGFNPMSSKILFISMMSVLCMLIVKSYKKKNICLFVAFVYMLPYTTVLYYILWGTNVQLSFYTQFNTQRAFFDSSMIFFLFLSSLNFFLKIPLGTGNFSCYKGNDFLFCLGIVGCLYAIIRGKSGDVNVFLNGEYTPDFSRSSLFEYFFVFYLISFVFSKNSKKYKYILYFIAFFYVGKNTIFGGRIESLMCVLFLLAIDLQKKIKFNTLLIFLASGYVLMFLLGVIRAYGFSWDLILNGLFSKGNGIITTQESDVNYASVRILEMVRLNIITTSQRFESLGLFFESLFLPKDSLPQLVDLSTYEQSSYPCGGGGLISAFAFVFLGYIGVIGIAFFVAKIFSNGVANKSLFKNLFFILTYTTMPRWFAYYPITLFKLALLGSTITWILIIIYDSYAKNKSFYSRTRL